MAAPQTARSAGNHLRLAMTPKVVVSNRLDGGWWPHSDRLPDELPALVKAIMGRFGRIRSVQANPHDWAELPADWSLPASRSPKVTLSGEHEQHVLTLVRDDGKRIVLLLVPATEDAGVARAAMHAAARVDNDLTAAQALRSARAHPFHQD